MSNYYNYILSAFILSGWVTWDAVASRKIMTQSNALPLIRLYGSCLAQERRTLVLLYMLRWQSLDHCILSNRDQETILDTFVLLLPTPCFRPQTQQSRIHFCVHSVFGTSEWYKLFIKIPIWSNQAPSPLSQVGRGQQGFGQQHGTSSWCSLGATELVSPRPDHQHPAPLLWHAQGREQSYCHFYSGLDSV